MEYNCRLYDYASGQHVTFYQKAINTGIKKKNENFEKTYHNEDRTDAEEKHCIQVSYNRTKNRIYQIARSNSWEWFITFTFDRTRTDASDYDEVTEKLQNFLEHLRQRKALGLIYLIVPELHKDKTHYHFHGLLAHCGNMRFSYSGKNDKKGNMIFNMPDWSFGFSTATRVADTKRVSHYITKYITKESTCFLKNKKRYYCPRNINIIEPEFFVLEHENFLSIYGDRIAYTKTVDIPDAGQRVTYYELRD